MHNVSNRSRVPFALQARGRVRAGQRSQEEARAPGRQGGRRGAALPVSATE